MRSRYTEVLFLLILTMGGVGCGDSAKPTPPGPEPAADKKERPR
jgi:hypothetical protein